MPTMIDSPPRVFGADARPTMLYDIGLSEDEAQWVVNASPSVMPNATSAPITVRFSSEALTDAERQLGAYYDVASAVIHCGPSARARSMGTIVHELAHSSGNGHLPAPRDGMPDPNTWIDMLEADRPFREVHASLLDVWERRLSLTRLNRDRVMEFAKERSEKLTAELQVSIENLSGVIRADGK